MGIAAAGRIELHGLADLNRAFHEFGKDIEKGLRDQLAEVAEPVKIRAEHLAVEKISNVGDRWSQMRIGITRHTVYIAPKQRRRRGSPRPNLGTLLLEDAMLPALAENENLLVERLDHLLGVLATEAGF